MGLGLCSKKIAGLAMAPLNARFPCLFNMVADPNILVAQAYEDNQWVIRFRRNLSSEELGQWQLLMLELRANTPSQDPDSVSWALESSGIFSANSLYNKLQQGVSVAHAKDI
jgi:hypothetical protein